MKRFFLISLAAAVGLLTSCSKEGPARFEGNWSFKTSGTVVLTPSASGSSELPDTVRIASESGRMDIVTADKSSGAVLITMNAILGDAVVMNATASGNRVDITPFERMVQLSSDAGVGVSANVTVSGYGERYDDTIIFRLEYSGHCTRQQVEYTVGGSNIVCVAKLNDF